MVIDFTIDGQYVGTFGVIKRLGAIGRIDDGETFVNQDANPPSRGTCDGSNPGCFAVLLDVDAGWYDVSNPDTPTSADAEPRPATPEPSAQPTVSPSASPSIEATATPEAAPTAAESPVGVVPR